MKKNTTLLTLLGAAIMTLTSCGGGTTSAPESSEPSSEPESSLPSSSEEIEVHKELTVKYIDGLGIKNVSVEIKEGDTVVYSGKTDAEGKLPFDVQGDKDLQVVITKITKGYTVDETYTFPKGESNYEIVASSEVIYDDLPSTKRYKVGDIVYDFEFETTTGDILYLSDVLQEKDLVVLNFWATWCGPCKAEFPYFNAAYHGQGGDEGFLDNVGVLLLNTDISMSQLKTYEASNQSWFKDFMMSLCPNELSRAFSVSAIPTTVFINKYGRIVRMISGSDTSYASWKKNFDLFSGEDAYLGTVSSYDGPVLAETPDSGDLEAVACDESFTATISMPTATMCYNIFGDSSMGGSLWPYAVDEEKGAIKATNSGYADTYGTFVLTANLKAGETLKCDVLSSCEESCDGLAIYSMANNDLSNELAYVTGVAEDWKTLTLGKATKDGTYQYFFIYMKDDSLNIEDDNVYIRNIHVEA